MIHLSRLSNDDQVFSLATEGGEVLHFAVDRLADYLAGSSWPVVRLQLHDQLMDAIEHNNGVELDHLDRLTDEQLLKPLLVVDHENGHHTVVDGSHRALRLRRDGNRTAPAWIVPQRLWRRFLIDGFPGDYADWKSFVTNPDFKANPGGQYGRPAAPIKAKGPWAP